MVERGAIGIVHCKRRMPGLLCGLSPRSAGLASARFGFARRCRCLCARSCPQGHVQLQAGALLQVAYDAEEVLRLRVTPRAEHTDETLGLRFRRRSELLESYRCLDIIAQDCLAGIDVTTEHRFDALAQ